MSNWTGDRHLLWKLRHFGGPYPSTPAPGAKAIPFGFEIPKDPWSEWLSGEYTVLKSPTYRSASQSDTISGVIE
jgi:hypothetical protein